MTMKTPTEAVNAFGRRLRRGAGELSRFGAVGIVAYVIDVGLFNVLVHVGDPGVLADRPLTAKTVSTVVATVFAEHGVSIAGVRQEGAADEASLIVRTHRAREADLQATIADLRDSPAVRAIVGLMRVEGAD